MEWPVMKKNPQKNRGTQKDTLTRSPAANPWMWKSGITAGSRPTSSWEGAKPAPPLRKATWELLEFFGNKRMIVGCRSDSHDASVCVYVREQSLGPLVSWPLRRASPPPRGDPWFRPSACPPRNIRFEHRLESLFAGRQKKNIRHPTCQRQKVYCAHYFVSITPPFLEIMKFLLCNTIKRHCIRCEFGGSLGPPARRPRSSGPNS